MAVGHHIDLDLKPNYIWALFYAYEKFVLNFEFLAIGKIYGQLLILPASDTRSGT